MKIKSMLLDIDLEDCIHRCVDDSACGKTALASIALQDATFNGTVILLDRKSAYDKFLSGGYTVSNDTIVIFDRMDLLGTPKIWSKLRTLKHTCVLVDAKSSWLGDSDYLIAYYEWIEDGGLRIRDDIVRQLVG